MLYMVLATGEPVETGSQDRFFQAQKQAQSFPVGSAGMHFIAGHCGPHTRMPFSLLGPENPCAAPGRTGVENWTRVGYR